jgi:hypothetical protein
MSNGNADCESPARDRLVGASSIAAFMGVTERVARYKLENGVWPHTREGRLHVASKRALARHWAEATGGSKREQETVHAA